MKVRYGGRDTSKNLPRPAFPFPPRFDADADAVVGAEQSAAGLQLEAAEEQSRAAIHLHVRDVGSEDEGPLLATLRQPFRDRHGPSHQLPRRLGILLEQREGARKREARILPQPQPRPFGCADPAIPNLGAEVAPDVRILRKILEELEDIQSRVERQLPPRESGRVLRDGTAEPEAVGELAGDADRLVVGDPGLHSRARRVQREREIVPLAAEPPAPQERPLERLGVELRGDLRRHLARARVDDDGPLREVSVANGREPADDLDALERVCRDLAQIHAAAGGCREADSGPRTQGLEVRVVGDGDAVQDDHGAEAREIVGPHAAGTGRRRRTEGKLLKASETRRFERHAGEQLQDAGERGGRLILDRLQLDDAGRGQLAPRPAHGVHRHRETLQLNRPCRDLEVSEKDGARCEGEGDAEVREPDSTHVDHLRAGRHVGKPIRTGGIAERGDVRPLDAHDGPIDRSTGGGLQNASRDGAALRVQPGRQGQQPQQNRD